MRDSETGVKRAVSGVQGRRLVDLAAEKNDQ